MDIGLILSVFPYILLVCVLGFALYMVLRQSVFDGMRDYDKWKNPPKP